MLRAVVPLVCGERLAGLRRGVVHEFVAHAGWRIIRARQLLPAGHLPCLATVARALDDLPEPAAGLRRVQPVRVGRRALHVEDLPSREVRAADVPLLALSVRCHDESALARTDQYPYVAHSVLLEEVSRWASWGRSPRPTP